MKILLAVDGSSGSNAAVQRVAALPWPTGSVVRVVTVDAPLGMSALGLGQPDGVGDSAYDQLIRMQRQQADQFLLEGARMLHELAPHLTVEAALLEGTPKEQITAEARRWGAEMVVVGSQGRGAFRSALLGSVSLSVVLNSPCSVLVVRDTAPAQ